VSSNIIAGIQKEINFELKEIEALFSLYKNELLELEREPNLIELTAIASVFHSFYSGVEKILMVVAKKSMQMYLMI
jgi:sugar-specific transcriptional regulator TrmB